MNMTVFFTMTVCLIFTQLLSPGEEPNTSALSEIQNAICTYTNNDVALRAVGLKYKNSEELEVSRSAHAALIRAHDVSEFNNVLAHYREALLTNSSDRYKFSSLMDLYLQYGHSSVVTSVLNNEIVILNSGQQDQSTALYRRSLLTLVLDSSPELAVDSWLRKETQALLCAATNQSVLVYNRPLFDSMLRTLATRGDSITPTIIASLRQLDDQYMEPYCKRYEWMYQVVTATYPEDTLRKAITSDDDILERWCIQFIHQKRLKSMLSFMEQRSRETSSLTRDYYLQLIHDLNNPEQIKGPIGSRENPIYSRDQLSPPPFIEKSGQR